MDHVNKALTTQRKQSNSRAKTKQPPQLNHMNLSFSFSKILKWKLMIAVLVFFTPRPSASRSTEVNLTCSSVRSSTSPFLNFLIMPSVLNQVSERKWGNDSVTNPLPLFYAFAQCHNDLPNHDCSLCFLEGRVKLSHCFPAISGRIFLHGCFLRYDNYSFFDENVDPRYDSVNCSDARGAITGNSSRTEFSNKVAGLIQNVMENALRNGTFAAVEASRGAVPAYGLAQCWNTLGAEKCRQCLETAGSELLKCAPETDGSALFTGCYMRYSTEKFFNNGVEANSIQRSRTGIIVMIVISVTALVMLAALGAYMCYRRLLKRKRAQKNLTGLQGRSNLNFEHEVLERATDFFNESKKLGQGGAGSVYKGILPDGKTVAVKRLVYNTCEWVDQLFNEVNLISNIRHKNLVRLLGCSIEGPESLLVFEYLPNSSLDQILFSENPAYKLSWQQRFNIILGIAEGLAYLHGHSGVKIIHRDIKASNILLDENLNPKIADFGLARSAPIDVSHISTGIAGTMGYMAPEYLVHGQLTEKVDAYAFGVLVQEIASGRKNSAFARESSSILHSVWKHYKANTLIQAIDPAPNHKFPEDQATIVLQIGLLCTQASASLRPPMEEVVQMLTNKECRIPFPEQPPFLNASVLSPVTPTNSSMEAPQA